MTLNYGGQLHCYDTLAECQRGNLSAMVCNHCGVAKISAYREATHKAVQFDVSRDLSAGRMSACLLVWPPAWQHMMPGAGNAGELLIYLRLSLFLAATQTYKVHRTHTL